MGQNGRWGILRFLIVAILGAVGGALITISVQIKDNRLAHLYIKFNSNFDQVKIGDTKDTVRQLLGKPTRIWPAVTQHTDSEETGIDSFTSATLGFRELWDYDIAERTYVVFFGPYPKWKDEMRVIGKHPDGERNPLKTAL